MTSWTLAGFKTWFKTMIVGNVAKEASARTQVQWATRDIEPFDPELAGLLVEEAQASLRVAECIKRRHEGEKKRLG